MYIFDYVLGIPKPHWTGIPKNEGHLKFCQYLVINIELIFLKLFLFNTWNITNIFKLYLATKYVFFFFLGRRTFFFIFLRVN